MDLQHNSTGKGLKINELVLDSGFHYYYFLQLPSNNPLFHSKLVFAFHLIITIVIIIVKLKYHSHYFDFYYYYY